MAFKIWVSTPVYISKELNTPGEGNVTFTSRLGGCSGTVETTGCGITINYYWEDIFADSGTATANITAGNNTVTQTPNGNELTVIDITSVSWSVGSCSGYSDTIRIC